MPDARLSDAEAAEIAAHWPEPHVGPDILHRALRAERKMERAFRRDDDPAERTHELERDYAANVIRRGVYALLADRAALVAQVAALQQRLTEVEADRAFGLAHARGQA